MSRNQKKRGISIGTICMLVISGIVLIEMLHVLVRLQNSVAIRADKTEQVLELSGELSVGVMDIPNVLLSGIQEIIGGSDESHIPQTTATPAPTAAPTATPYAGSSFTLTAGGMFSIESAVRQSCYYRDSKKYDLDELVQLIAAEVDSTLNIASLENVTISSEASTNLNAPSAVMSMLRSCGFDTVALGFNKALDKGANGLLQTIEQAHKEGLQVIGAYDSHAVRTVSAQIQNINNLRVAVLHYTSPDYMSGTTKRNQASGEEWLLPLTDEAVADVRQAKKLGAQVVIVSLNWNRKDSTAPTAKQQQLAQALANAGADVILGSGSRVIQSVNWLTAKREQDKTSRTLCCYDLGSLISDSRTNNGVAGMLIHMQIDVDATEKVEISNVSYTPTYVWRYKQDGSDHYRIINSSEPSPDGMNGDLEKSKSSAMSRTEKKINNPDIHLRIPQ